jgi:hypothetical protein
VRTDKRLSQKSDKKAPSRANKRGIVGYSKKSALLEEAITHMNTGKYGRSSAALKELLTLDPQNLEARRLFATLHLRLGSLVTARHAFESLANEAIGRQDYWLAESLLREYLAAGPRCVPFLEQLATVYQEKGDEMAAVGELGKAIEILRDDGDTENPFKAAQLYSKIRELAPASSVAMELAPLFDVQTGEFIGRTSAGPAVSDEASTSNESAMPLDISPSPTVTEYATPELMPWELPDEPDSATEVKEAPEPILEPELEAVEGESDIEACAPTEFLEATALASPQVPEEAEPAIETEILQHQPVYRDSTSEETSFSLKFIEDTPSTSLPDSSLCAMPTSESPSATSPDIPSPMPWEQMADASVQILEPEAPAAPETSSTLESVLASLPSENDGAGPSAVIEEPSLSVAAHAPQQPIPDTPLESGQAESAQLSAPMPWEQISDPAIQISVQDNAPLPPPEDFLPPNAVTGLEDSPVAALDVCDPSLTAASPIEKGEVSPIELSPLPEPAPSAEETPSSPSFSWNSVFDKAWKFTAGTMAPSPTVPEKESGWSDEPQHPEAPVVENPATDLSVADPPINQQEEPSSAPSSMPMTCEAGSGVQESPSTPPAVAPASDTASHWNTGEVAVQVHRPSQKKKRWEKAPQEAEPATMPSSGSESLTETVQEAIRAWKSTSDEPAPLGEEPLSTPPDTRPDWMQATETITFNRAESPPPRARWSDAEATLSSGGEAASSAAVSAVDVLFASSGTDEDVHPHPTVSWSPPRPRLMARLHRVRIGIFSFIGSCFSTTRSISFLVAMVSIAVMVVATVGIAAVGIIWMAMEEPPSALYQSLTISPPRMITDAKKNGYLLLLGFDAPVGQDPVQAGYERKPEQASDRVAAQVCVGDESKAVSGGGASDHMVKGWIRSSDPLTSIRGQGATLKSLTVRESTALARYQQWLTMPFDDWGFGQVLSPNCNHVLLAHRLFVLEGFNQDLSIGLDRLEADAQAWRSALGQSKTLALKMLAVTAVQDDATVASGLLSRADLDGAAIARLSKILRPLDQVELSVRWPMQSQFVWATKHVAYELREDNTHERPWHASLTAAMRLPLQRRANAYAEYYEATNKAVAGGRYTTLPKVSTFVRTPPSGVMDYLTNPLEHIVGVDPLPSWEPYVVRMIEADAQLRLAGLQAWLRRGPQDSDVLMRLAKAGQAYYDPFTGLPMLVNQRKGVLYSVGRDGKDQEGDDVRDVTVMIPLSSDPRRSAVSPSLR